MKPDATIELIEAFLRERFPDIVNEPSVPLRWQGFSRVNSSQTVQRLGFALDGKTPLDGEWDALIVHRPFDLPADLPDNLPIFAIHRPLDAHLTPGNCRAFAYPLWMEIRQHLYRTDRGVGADERIGQIGQLQTPVEWEALRSRLALEFGGLETIVQTVVKNRPNGMIDRVAVAEAMTRQTVRDAAEAGAKVYLTGQLREAAIPAAEEHGLIVVATGHRRWETWGLRQLQNELTTALNVEYEIGLLERPQKDSPQMEALRQEYAEWKALPFPESIYAYSRQQTPSQHLPLAFSWVGDCLYLFFTEGCLEARRIGALTACAKSFAASLDIEEPMGKDYIERVLQICTAVLSADALLQ